MINLRETFKELAERVRTIMSQKNIVELAERRRQKMLNKPKDRGMEMLAYAMVVLFVGMLLFVAIAIDWQ